MDEIQKSKKSGEHAPKWFTDLLTTPEMKAQDLYGEHIDGLGYPGDRMPSYLGPGQYGPMTEKQSQFEEGRQERKAANQERDETFFGQLMNSLFKSGREEPAEPGFLDFLMKAMQEKKP